MFLESSIIEALLIVGVAGGIAGLIGGFLASADNLIGTFLIGVLSAVALSAIFRIAGAPPIYDVGQGFSAVWAAVAGLVMGFVVGKSNV